MSKQYLWHMEATMGADGAPWTRKDFVAGKWAEAVKIAECFIKQESTKDIDITKLKRGREVDFLTSSTETGKEAKP